jgi:hypothetical protein
MNTERMVQVNKNHQFIIFLEENVDPDSESPSKAYKKRETLGVLHENTDENNISLRENYEKQPAEQEEYNKKN